MISLKRKADFLDKYAERTEDGILHRELIGVYINYQLKLGWNVENPSDYDRLWDTITSPKEFHAITVPYGRRSSHTFQAYVSNVSDDLMKSRDGNHYWKNLTVNFIAQRPKSSVQQEQSLPERNYQNGGA